MTLEVQEGEDVERLASGDPRGSPAGGAAIAYISHSLAESTWPLIPDRDLGFDTYY